MIETLLEAIVLVVLVVYFFLQNPRSTLIPTISIFVSLIGTFAVLYLAGFSINLLTLFALVLAIGTIVDDAIIVVEAVQTKFDEGYKSTYRAAVDAMDGVSSALVTSTLVFMAVFVPVSFMGGTSGVFYTQFGITMAVAVGISAVNALTLSPALCALILRPNQQLKDGEKPLRNVLHVGGAASHISVLTGLELLLQVLRRPGYGVFRVDRLGMDDVLNGALEFAVLQHHPVNLEDGRFSLPHLPQGLFMQPVQLL